MYIFKQPKIGGEVVCHQDSTFLYTKPESAVGFWVAIEDATINNGCMWTVKGGHKGPLRKLFKRADNCMIMSTLDSTPFEEMDTILEVKKGTLILLHGRLPHYSCENKSNKSRHAYTLHVIDSTCDYPKFNWLQRSTNLPLKGFID
jgi:phytanoyl-CoA hydroxylase